MTRAFADRSEFAGYRKIILDLDEEYAANGLWINGCILAPSGFPKTRKKLEVLKCKIIELDVSEARKMDGGLTCISLRYDSVDFA